MPQIVRRRVASDKYSRKPGFLEEPLKMAKVLMYTTAVCPYCIRAEQLLNRKGVTEIEKVRVDLQPELRAEMMEKTGRRTVPQIYINGQHVGGFDDLAELNVAGELDELLAKSSV
jgi:glutaredoxin 3